MRYLIHNTFGTTQYPGPLRHKRFAIFAGKIRLVGDVYFALMIETFRRYCIFCFIMTSFVYPVVVAWTWSCAGWLNYVGAGYMDFAGSGIVHLCGGAHGSCVNHFRALSRVNSDSSGERPCAH